MKKKLLLISLMLALFVCIFALSVSAEAPSMYIEFGARFPGSDEYITVYTENAESLSNPRIDFANKLFYSDVDFTQEVDMSTVTGIDFSVAKTYASGVEGKAPTRMVKPSNPFVNCTEVKWFLAGMPTVSYDKSFFKGWTGLKSFDFGNATAIADNTFEGCGLESITIPASITSIGGSAFKDCKSLKSVKFEGTITSFGNGSTFSGCTSLTSVDLGSITSICDKMFYGCTSLKSVVLPSTVKNIYKDSFKGCTGITTADLGQITSMSYGAFSGCTSLTSVIIPNTLTTMGDTNFDGCTSLKYVKIPNSVTSMGYGTFQNCTALEFAEISNATGYVPTQMFYKCTSLKAISIPEGITKINEYAFAGCSELKATYLPSTLITIGTNGAWGAGAFDSCKKLYFVQDPISVKDEAGNWLGNSFVMPTEPEVYYMPSQLTTLFGCEFKDCQQINRYVVFPTGVTKITSWEGAFSVTGTNNTKGAVTYVFLGDIDTFCYSARDGRYKNVSYIFANPNDTSISSFTKFQLGYRAAAVNSYAYFCAGNVVYDLSSFTPPNETYTVQETDFKKTAYTAETQPHFADPNKTVLSPADCENNEKQTKYCFCGADCGVTEVENSALGHEFDLEKGAVITNILYNDGFLNEGCKEINCARCNEKNYDTKVIAIFDFLGYATDKDGTRLVSGYITNVAEYNAYTEFNTLEFGVVAYIPDGEATTCTPIEAGENGVEIVDKDYTIHASLDVNCSAYDFILSGFGAEHTDLEVAMCAYVYDGKAVSYLCYGADGEFGEYDVAHTITISSEKVTPKEI